MTKTVFIFAVTMLLVINLAAISGVVAAKTDDQLHGAGISKFHPYCSYAVLAIKNPNRIADQVLAKHTNFLRDKIIVMSDFF